jgi:hypothetical protein
MIGGVVVTGGWVTRGNSGTQYRFGWQHCAAMHTIVDGVLGLIVEMGGCGISGMQYRFGWQHGAMMQTIVEGVAGFVLGVLGSGVVVTAVVVVGRNRQRRGICR